MTGGSGSLGTMGLYFLFALGLLMADSVTGYLTLLLP